MRTVSFVTMGCAKNEVDSDHMATLLEEAGYSITDEAENADVVIVNTCSFIQAATEESIEAILEVAGFDSIAHGRSHLVVAGCMPSRYGADLEKELPEVGEFVPCADESSIVDVVRDLLKDDDGQGLGIPYHEEGTATRVPAARASVVSAYVKISDGCDRFCSYCTIPFIRGRYHSFTLDEIDAEIARVVARGACEIVLIAQDTGRWGDDFDTPSSLAKLVAHVAEKWPQTWFRIMYIQPEGITDEFLEAVATHENVCNYFDIPFQHSCARILSAMNRTGSGEEYLGLSRRIRNRIPDATLRTTLIAGYPGETDDDFEELCDFVESLDFDYVGVFAYSREDGTRADMQSGHLDDDEKLARAQRLRDIADASCMPRIAQRVSREMNVLVCGREEDGQLYGRAMCQAPDVDGVTYVNDGKPGEIVRVVIDDTLLYEMEGTVLL